ncbi:MAG: RnfABCDGE type electron transport complex subunit D [Spirochaetes bacterium]|nr:RnfABCDGE type electron transport complex subunit D [Spirochaetota bacterium]
MINNRNLIMSPAPHLHIGASIAGLMKTYLIALLPLIIFAVYGYGWHAVRVIALSASSAMLWELLIQKLFRRKVTIYDGTAMISGIIFAMLLPASAPWWLVITGTFIAMLIGKHIFGGNGAHPFNPVLIAWAAVSISWKSQMDLGTAMVNYDKSFPVDFPLTVLKKAGAEGLGIFNIDVQGMWSGKLSLFLGNQIGGLGTTAGFLIIIAGLFLILRGKISWRIPSFFILGVFFTALLFRIVNPETYADPVFHILTGSVLFGAVFLATDCASSPVNKTAMALFGLGCGIFTVLFRAWSIYPDAVPFAILIMNILNPLLDKIHPKIPGNNVNVIKVES